MKTSHLLIIGALLLPAPLLPTTVKAEETVAQEITADIIDPAPFEALLRRYVDSKGMVDYAQWHSNLADRQALEHFLKAISEANTKDHSPTSQLAFFLNAYNALTIQDVLSRWPVETVINIEGFFNGKKHRVAGEHMTLDELEHTRVIRAQFQEPRIHFILVCAAHGCPRLRTTAMRAQNLEAQLEAAAGEFINRSTRQIADDKIEISPLFQWYAQDFINDAGSIAAYLRKYVRDASLRRILQDDDLQISFSDYDWTLNQRLEQPPRSH